MSNSKSLPVRRTHGVIRRQDSHARDDKRCEVFTQSEFPSRFANDLQKAAGRVIIVSPFATVRGVGYYRAHFEAAILRNVSICAIVSEPDGWDEKHKPASVAPPQLARVRSLEATIELLESIGVHVTTRPAMHEKVVVVDDCILWEGSLNVLSFYKTTERTRRWFDREEVDDATALHKMLDCAQCLATATPWQQLIDKRVGLGLTQTELAALAGTNKRLISETESGTRNLRMQSLQQITAAMDLELVFAPKHLVNAVRGFIKERSNPRI